MDIRKVKKLIELLEESGIDELEIREGEESVRISRHSKTAAQPVYGRTHRLAHGPAPGLVLRLRRVRGAPRAHLAPHHGLRAVLQPFLDRAVEARVARAHRTRTDSAGSSGAMRARKASRSAGIRPRPRVLLADDHKLVASGVRRLLESRYQTRVVDNGRVLRTVFQMVRSEQFGRRGLSSSLRRAFQRWLNEASSSSLPMGRSPSSSAMRAEAG